VTAARKVSLQEQTDFLAELRNRCIRVDGQVSRHTMLTLTDDEVGILDVLDRRAQPHGKP
jgi:hypothetical protein